MFFFDHGGGSLILQTVFLGQMIDCQHLAHPVNKPVSNLLTVDDLIMSRWSGCNMSFCKADIGSIKSIAFSTTRSQNTAYASLFAPS